MKGATAYEVVKNSSSVADTTFDYNADEQSVGFALNGKALTVGSKAENEIASIAWYKGEGPSATAIKVGGDGTDKDDPVASTWTPTNAGTYTAVLTGNTAAGYEGDVAVVVKVNQLNLSKANIVVGEAAGSTAFEISSINGAEPSAALLAMLNVETVKSPNDLPQQTPAGEYELKITPVDDEDENIVGEQTVTANRVESTAVTWFYGNQEITASWAPTTINLANGDSAFNMNQLYVGATADLGDGALAAADRLAYTYTVTDAKGNVVANNSITKPGTWNVTAKVDAEANGYKFGGNLEFTVTVINGVITSNDIVVKQDGQVTSTPTFTYDGTNVLDKIDITVTCGGKTLTKGTDYTLVAKLDSQEVDAAIDADTYTVEVVAPAYEVAENSFQVVVEKVKITGWRIAGKATNPTTDESFLPYTGKEIVPVIEYTTADDPADKDAVWATLPSDLYTLSYEGTAGDATGDTELKDKGTYTVTIAANGENEVSDNYNFTTANAATDEVVVAEGTSLFQDVKATSWYYEVVNKAAKNKYMTGIGGTQLFKPNAKITRAEVVAVLYKMAGGTNLDATLSYNTETGYNTGFEDVDGMTWYAKPIAWAKQAGIISGYADGKKFGPNDTITREQFAAMLCSYAKAMDNYTAVEDVATVLASKTGGKDVSNWAKESVAWAVSNEYMGNGSIGIAPLNTVTRAEVAAMAVAYQPEPLVQVDAETE